MAHQAADMHAEHVHDHHPGAAIYIRVAVALAVLTAIEVGAFYIEMTSWLMVWILLLLGLAKFFLVVGFFMHLKMDNKLFSMLFFFPMTVMVSIAVVLMAVFHNLTR
jgi:cytochrome c oxidase subunit 4